jgi:hypothetical protein
MMLTRSPEEKKAVHALEGMTGTAREIAREMNEAARKERKAKDEAHTERRRQIERDTRSAEEFARSGGFRTRRAAAAVTPARSARPAAAPPAQPIPVASKVSKVAARERTETLASEIYAARRSGQATNAPCLRVHGSARSTRVS